MFDSPIFDTVFGLIIVYTIFSIVVSAIQECAAGLLQLRSKTLRQGIENLIGAQHTALLYRHGLVRGLSRKRARWTDAIVNGGEPRGPANIPAATFAAALTDVLTAGSARSARSDDPVLTLTDVQDGVARLPDADLKDALTALLQQTEFDIDDFRKRAARWFDDAMDRVRGWYARQARLWSLCVAALLVVVLNADTLRIGTMIWQDESIRARLIASAPASIKPTPEELDRVFAAIPLGWPCPKSRKDKGESFCVIAGESGAPLPGSGWPPRVIGWLLTIFAVSLGAPFWFDLMNRVASLRTAGRLPQREETAKG